jgi:hypothetical protein
MDFLNKTEAGEMKSARHELVWPGLELGSHATLFSLNMVNRENAFLYKFIGYHIDPLLRQKPGLFCRQAVLVG